MGRWVCDIFSHFVVRTFYVAKYILKDYFVLMSCNMFYPWAICDIICIHIINTCEL